MGKVEEVFLLQNEQAHIGARVAFLLSKHFGARPLLSLLDDKQEYLSKIASYADLYRDTHGSLRQNAEQSIALRYLEDSLRSKAYYKEIQPIAVDDNTGIPTINAITTHYITVAPSKGSIEATFQSAAYHDKSGTRWRIAFMEINGKRLAPIKITEEFFGSGQVTVQTAERTFHSLRRSKPTPIVGFDVYKITSNPPRNFHVSPEAPLIIPFTRGVYPTSA